jgi:protein involved in polysaccharide export with SLBB domain
MSDSAERSVAFRSDRRHAGPDESAGLPLADAASPPPEAMFHRDEMNHMLIGLLTLLLVVPAPGWSQSAPQPGGGRDVTLMPGDIVRIEIWREEDLSGDFQVAPDGTVTLPLLGRQSVVGLPLDRFRDTLLEQYRVELRNPSITITPLRRVHVLGEVNQPGLYPIDPTLSLAGAVALAGGATPSGDLGKIRVVRGGEVLRLRVGPGATLESADVRSGDQIFVERRSWFERNSTFVVSALLSVTSLAITILR